MGATLADFEAHTTDGRLVLGQDYIEIVP